MVSHMNQAVVARTRSSPDKKARAGAGTAGRTDAGAPADPKDAPKPERRLVFISHATYAARLRCLVRSQEHPWRRERLLAEGPAENRERRGEVRLHPVEHVMRFREEERHLQRAASG